MKFLKIIFFLWITFFSIRINAQITEKSISLGIGPAFRYPTDGIKVVAPGLLTDFTLGKNEKNKFGIQIKFTEFKANNDTVYLNREPPNLSEKIYDLTGSISMVSLTALWQRSFFTERNNQAFVELGLGFMRYEREFVWTYSYNVPEAIPYEQSFGEGFGVLTLNVGGGFRQKLGEKFSVFEKVQVDYLFLFKEYLQPIHMRNYDIEQNFYLFLSFGCSYSFN